MCHGVRSDGMSGSKQIDHFQQIDHKEVVYLTVFNKLIKEW